MRILFFAVLFFTSLGNAQLPYQLKETNMNENDEFLLNEIRARGTDKNNCILGPALCVDRGSRWVGVNTYIPQYGLDVSTGMIVRSTFTVTGEAILASTSGNVSIASATPQSRLVVGSGSSIFTVNSSGQVSIGTDTFSTQLHALAPTGSAAIARFRIQNLTDASIIQGLSGGTNKWDIGSEGSNAGGNVVTGSSANDLVLLNQQSAAIRLATGGIIRASFLNSGNVGLSSTAPSNLFVVGSGTSIFTVNSNGQVAIGTDSFSSQLHVLSPTGQAVTARFRAQNLTDTAVLQGLAGGTNKWDIGSEGSNAGGNVVTGSSANDLVLLNQQPAGIRLATGGAIRATILNSGQFGVANASPLFGVDVASSLRVTGGVQLATQEGSLGVGTAPAVFLHIGTGAIPSIMANNVPQVSIGTNTLDTPLRVHGRGSTQNQLSLQSEVTNGRTGINFTTPGSSSWQLSSNFDADTDNDFKLTEGGTFVHFSVGGSTDSFRFNPNGGTYQVGINVATTGAALHIKQQANGTTSGQAFEESGSTNKCFIFAVTTISTCPIGASTLDVGTNVSLCAQCD